MKYINYALFLIIISTVILSCQKQKPDKLYSSIEIKVYGKDSSMNDSLSVFVNLYHFTSMDSLFRRVEDIVCEDSVPKILINSLENQKIIYPKNSCYRGMDISIRPPHNHIYIYDDTIVKYFVYEYPLDSLEYVMQKDLENMGQEYGWADHPDKLVFLFGDKFYKPQKLENKLNQVADTYEKLTGKRDIKIYLTIPPKPPPPPPETGVETQNKVK